MKKNCLYAPVQEEVVAVLKQAKEGNPVESVRLVDCQLRQLPEAFGRIQGRALKLVCEYSLDLLRLHVVTILDNLDIHRVTPKEIFLGYYIAEHYKECLLKTSIANSKWNILCTFIHGDNFFH